MGERALSIVIPAWNEEPLIGGALASIAQQDVPLETLEAIVVDNGSTDRTAEVAEAFAAARPRLAIRLLRDGAPRRARAKNLGARAATGTTLLFLDADSRMAPDLARRILARVDTGCPAADVRVVADTRDPLDRAFFALTELRRLFRIRAQMFYCPREAFLATGGFDETLQIAEDRDLLRRLARSGVRVCHLDESWIATSPRRLHSLPLRAALVTTFTRWALAHAGIGRRWRY